MKTKIRQFLLPAIYSILAAVVLLIPALVPATVNAQDTESECWAVIVGISNFQNYAVLPNASDDAQALADRLGPIWGTDHIKLLTDTTATKQAIQDAITDWLATRAKANDTVLFYWAGREDDTNGNGYLFPYDSRTDSNSSDISGIELNDWLYTLVSKKIVVMNIDAGKLIDTLSGTGRVFLTPNAVGESAWYVPAIKGGVFAHYILEALDNFMAATNNGNFELSVEEIFDYAKTKTTDYSASYTGITIQHPQIYDGYEGELNLLIKVTASVAIGITPVNDILTIDGTKYSSTSLPKTFIWAAGSYHDFQATSTISGVSGTQYVFDSWNNGSMSSSRTISAGGTYTADYTTQYYLTVESGFGSPRGAGWYDSGSTADISVTANVEQSGARHTFTGWSGDYSGNGASASVVMNKSKKVTASWQTDYLLTVVSEYGDPQGGGWYSSGSEATISVTSPIGVIIRQVFSGWSGDYSGDTASVSVILNEPMTITANWSTDMLQLYIIIIVVVLILVGLGVWLFIFKNRKGNKKQKGTVKVSTTTESDSTPSVCDHCGTEIKPGDAFCIKCGKPVKDN